MEPNLIWIVCDAVSTLEVRLGAGMKSSLDLLYLSDPECRMDEWTSFAERAWIFRTEAMATEYAKKVGGVAVAAKITIELLTRGEP